ncbi:hypothetical protein P7C73_g5529, partial [Tremellales sp. Uapishka_1]
MPAVKREHSEEGYHVTPPPSPVEEKPSPTKKPRKANPATPSKNNASAQSNEGRSSKSIFAEMIIHKGIADLSTAEVEAATGLTPSQQKDLTRKDKGSLRKVLMTCVVGL